jgi:hypothetical protein
MPAVSVGSAPKANPEGRLVAGVDGFVEGFPSGIEVKDPYSGKILLTP